MTTDTVKKQPFMLVSLNEQKAKKLSHVLSNKTAVKILDFLAGKDASESDIAKALKIPLSTVHYNMQQLVEAKLVVCEEFHYSSRGKEVNHYTLANKYIIIAPTEEDESFLQHLKKFLPVGVLLVGVAALVNVLRLRSGGQFTAKVLPMAAESAADSAEMLAAPMGQSAELAVRAAEPVVQTVPWWNLPAVDWVLWGALGMLVIVVLIDFFRKR